MQSFRGIIAGLVLAVAVFATGAVDARPAIVVDAATGAVIHSQDASQSWYPASLTKLLTAYVVFGAIQSGEITLDTPLTYSATAAAVPPAKMGFKPGTVVTVDNALKMLIVRSANDVALMIAENLGGVLGVDGFVRRMNATAAHLGMTGSRFINPHGLPGEGQVTTARDLALLAQAIYRDFPQHGGYFSIGAIQFGKRTLRAYNMLLARYDGADGMKTGFICASGFNLVATATRAGRRLIVVVLGSASGRLRAENAARLLEDGFTRPFDADAMPVQMMESRLGDPPDLRPEICERRPVTAKAAASESDGLDGGGEGDIAEQKSLLAAMPSPVVPVRVFVGPKPNGSGAGDAHAPMALTAPLPLPRPLPGGTLDPAEIARGVRQAVAGKARPRDPGAPRADLATGARATTPAAPASARAATPAVPMPHGRPTTP